ncbi:hypothetical protein GGQ74_002940 [Desulfobaculum xiamenense]|uniref:Uncharacterized protein n=1 Tax=Desulfobaculum xiamenense TaxID=995050 RepID=A0A846QS97_9BACT|nr:hypothetical protein [Desulfobaculum xiamenense]
MDPRIGDCPRPHCVRSGFAAVPMSGVQGAGGPLAGGAYGLRLSMNDTPQPLREIRPSPSYRFPTRATRIAVRRRPCGRAHHRKDVTL